MQMLRAERSKSMATRLLLASIFGAAGFVLVLVSMLASALAPVPVRAQDATAAVGELQIAAGETGPISGYVLTLEGMPEAPAGNHYELWAVPEGADPVRLDALALEDGALVLEGALTQKAHWTGRADRCGHRHQHRTRRRPGAGCACADRHHQRTGRGICASPASALRG